MEESSEWPPLDDFEAPYREPILAPTSSSSTLSSDNIANGIISILPAPAKFNTNQRLPRNYFMPSILLNSTPSPPPPLPPLVRIEPEKIEKESTTEGFLPVTPSWLQTTAVCNLIFGNLVNKFNFCFQTETRHQSGGHGHISLNPRYVRQNDAPNQSLWAQIATRPILSHVQKRPKTKYRSSRHHRRPKSVVTVKHGIYPILKTRRRVPITYFHYYH